MFAGLWESPAERRERERRERRQRNQAIGVGIAGVVGVFAAAGAAAGAAGAAAPRTRDLSEVKDRLRADYLFGFTDTAGAQAFDDHRAEMAGAERAAADAEARRTRFRAAAGLFAGLAVALGAGTWFATASAAASCGVAGVLMLIAARVFAGAGRQVPPPQIAPPPVVLPSAPRSSPARPLLQCVADRRVQIGAAVERLEGADPDAAELVRIATGHGEAWVAECGARHEMHRHLEHGDKKPRGDCRECEAALAALAEAVGEYQGLAGDAVALGGNGSGAREAIARRAGIAALRELDG